MDTFMGLPITGDNNVVEVDPDHVRSCDLCEAEGRIRQAEVDAKTASWAGYGGAWANMCRGHFADYGIGLGTGLGQRYVVKARTS